MNKKKNLWISLHIFCCLKLDSAVLQTRQRLYNYITTSSHWLPCAASAGVISCSHRQPFNTQPTTTNNNTEPWQHSSVTFEWLFSWAYWSWGVTEPRIVVHVDSSHNPQPVEQRNPTWKLQLKWGIWWVLLVHLILKSPSVCHSFFHSFILSFIPLKFSRAVIG